MNRTLDEMLNDPNPDHITLPPLKEDLENAGCITGELKPCPFCGCNTILTTGRQNKASSIFGYQVFCTNIRCNATMYGSGHTQKEARNSAIEQWNKREEINA